MEAILVSYFHAHITSFDNQDKLIHYTCGYCEEPIELDNSYYFHHIFDGTPVCAPEED